MSTFSPSPQQQQYFDWITQSTGSAILSAVMLKAGVYGVLRVAALLPPVPHLGAAVMGLGALTALAGVGGAQARRDGQVHQRVHGERHHQHGSLESLDPRRQRRPARCSTRTAAPASGSHSRSRSRRRRRTPRGRTTASR